MRNYAPYRHIFCAFVEVKSKYNVEFKNDFMATYRFIYKEMYNDKDVIVNEDGKIVLDY